MKLIRVGQIGEERPGLLLENGRRVDVSAVTKDYTPDFFENDGLARLESWAQNEIESASSLSDDERLGSPIARPGKIICIGLNYSDHAAESAMDLPEEPIVFFKATSALCGPNDDLVIPKGSTKTDWEVELAVLIGRRASYVEPEQAMDYVLGYALHNDYSERAFQLERGGQWVKGKSCDTFAPLGPFVATRDEIEDPHRLRLWLTVNQEMRQESNTKNLVFNVPTIVSYLSQFMTLEPGDIISTGTPGGVGLGFDPPIFLKPGDIVELGVEGLGTSSQQSVAYGEKRG